jgi:tRNA 2-selenouridine synthase
VPIRRITAAEALSEGVKLAHFSAVLDARSEAEFAEDHLPGAVNWPTLNDAERHLVGTQYKQDSPFDARKHGAVLAARNIARHVETHAAGLQRNWKPLVYCWRGGQRSGALATVLGAIGFDVSVLEGGYREFRRAVVAALETAGVDLRFKVLCGATGSGKSRLLQALNQAGAQVLDLEDLAQHRGSVLGALPGLPQPTQKRFETLVWQALQAFDRQRPVYVESESRLVGRLRVPESLLTHMRASACVRVNMPMSVRVDLLVEDYLHLVNDSELLCGLLQRLRDLRGAAVVERWQALARLRQVDAMRSLVQELLEQHYDPIYERSMQGNYGQLAGALQLPIKNPNPAALLDVAQALLERDTGP